MFVDLQKTYDKANELELWEKNCEYGAEDWLLNVNIIWIQYLNIRGTCNEWFSIEW